MKEDLKGDPAEFWDYFTANGWKTTRGKMKNWYSAARNWSRREREKASVSDPALERIRAQNKIFKGE